MKSELTRVFLLALICLLPCDPLVGQGFTKIIGDPVVSDDRYSEGSSWGDVNNDGYPDLFVPDLHSDKRNILFLNNGNGSFSEVTTGPIVTDISTSPGGCFGDFDNDGDLDLFVVNYLGNNSFYYANNGEGTFSAVTEGVLVSDGGWSFGTSVADYDNDGFLDIFVTNIGSTDDGEENFLYRNNGDGSFTGIRTGAVVNDVATSASSSWCDYDSDGDVDLFVANGGTFTPVQAENVIYQNNNDGTFTRISGSAIGIDKSWAGFGGWGDYDNDGDFDLMVTNFSGDNNILYKNNGDGTFTRVTEGAIVNDGGDSVSSSWGDYDNDGDLDLYVTNDFNEDNVLYENNGDGSFTKISAGDPVSDGGRSNGATWADYDLDGFLDLFVPNGQRPVSQSNILYRNNGNGNHWINVECEGISSNRTAIGTIARARATINGIVTWQLRQISGSTGFNAQNSFNIEFGIGDAVVIDSLILDWPSGMVDIYTEVDADLFYRAVEGSGLDPVVTSAEEQTMEPMMFRLSQNFPNPFNSSTTFHYTLSREDNVLIRISDLPGRNVTTLVDQLQLAGRHSVVWKGGDSSGRVVPSGIYFLRMKAGEHFETRKMLLLR